MGTAQLYNVLYTYSYNTNFNLRAEVVANLSTFLYIYQTFILPFHKAQQPPSLVLSVSLSMVPHPVVLIWGLSLRVGDVYVFFLQSIFLQLDIHHPVTNSTLMQWCHLVIIASPREYCHLVIITALRQLRNLVIIASLRVPG